MFIYDFNSQYLTDIPVTTLTGVDDGTGSSSTTSTFLSNVFIGYRIDGIKQDSYSIFKEG